jgi:K+-transporting ATPase ATPase A chain
VTGPVASLESIKHIGTNGGGFFSMNAAHPFENPTPLTNTLHMLSMLLIPSALTYTLGTMIGRRRQGWVILGAFVVMFVGFLAVIYSAEQHGNPLVAGLGVDQQMSARSRAATWKARRCASASRRRACSPPSRPPRPPARSTRCTTR